MAWSQVAVRRKNSQSRGPTERGKGEGKNQENSNHLRRKVGKGEKKRYFQVKWEGGKKIKPRGESTQGGFWASLTPTGKEGRHTLKKGVERAKTKKKALAKIRETNG